MFAAIMRCLPPSSAFTSSPVNRSYIKLSNQSGGVFCRFKPRTVYIYRGVYMSAYIQTALCAWVCKCTCVCIYVYIYTHGVHTEFVCACTYVHGCVCVCLRRYAQRLSVCVYMFVYIHAALWVCVQIRMCVYICLRMDTEFVCACTYVHGCVCACLRI